MTFGAASRCWDNAPSESFFKTLKAELVYHENFRTKKEAESAIFDFIEIWYNRKRRHSFLNYQIPSKNELDFSSITNMLKFIVMNANSLNIQKH
ncbi:IS3 family transposase [Rhizosphaericola mali]|uniref:IS3 family transposase n=1 Tax=Rhizosphaericola mali TaxID=2545455 RepID=A0A5P2G6G2_9BACT|nr:IS3 family transposase [Rhizosphaericola mali]